MPIEIKNLQHRVPLSPGAFLASTGKILKTERVSVSQLSVVFVNDRKIRALNKAFLGRDETTDVIAFDLRTPSQRQKPAKRAGDLDGEIVISAPRARANARRYKVTLQQELLLLIAHGIAHLLGYDDHTPADRRRMRKKERELLALSGPARRAAAGRSRRRAA